MFSKFKPILSVHPLFHKTLELQLISHIEMLQHVARRFLAPVRSSSHASISSGVRIAQSRWFHQPVVDHNNRKNIDAYERAAECVNGEKIEGLLTIRNTGQYSYTIAQARQVVSHQRFCVHVGNRNSIYFYSTSQGDKPDDDKPQDDKSEGERKSIVDVYGEGIRRRFYVNLLLEKIISKSLPQRMWRRTKAEWYRLLRTRRGSRLLLKSRFLRDLHTTMQEEDMERTKKLGSEKVCLGSSFAEHIKIKRNLYHFKHFFLSKRRNDQSLNLPPRSKGPFVSKASIYSSSTYASRYPFTRKPRIRKIELPTHYLEINYKTLKAVVTYGPNVSHIPSKIRHLL